MIRIRIKIEKIKFPIATPFQKLITPPHLFQSGHPKQVFTQYFLPLQALLSQSVAE